MCRERRYQAAASLEYWDNKLATVEILLEAAEEAKPAEAPTTEETKPAEDKYDELPPPDLLCYGFAPS